jgi:hypothetical protein
MNLNLMAFGPRRIWWPFLTLPSPLGEGGLADIESRRS